MTNMEDRVKKIISEKLCVDLEKILLNSSLSDNLSADSLDFVELVMTLEDEFNMEITDEDAEKLKTVEDIVNFINNSL